MAILSRYSSWSSSFASSAFESEATSARIAGISVVTSTRNGADLTPRSRVSVEISRTERRRRRCTAVASAFDCSCRRSA
jgi:hypothetical protein